jgi:hypothetical protein
LVCSNSNDDLNIHPESNRIPHVVTDRAIDVGRSGDWDRMIVHYNLPHLDHIAGALDWERGELSTEELNERAETSS